MNYGQIWGQVSNLTPSTSTANDQAWVNWGYHEFLEASQWSFREASTTVALVAGTKAYTVLGTAPSLTDFDTMIKVELEMTAGGARIPLPQAAPQNFSRLFSHCFTNSQPVAWTILGGAPASTSGTVVSGGQQQLTLSHPPTAVAGQGVNLFCRYLRAADGIEMTANADVPIAPNRYHRLIVLKSAAYAAEMLAMGEDVVQGFERQYQAGLATAIGQDLAARSSDAEMLEIATLPQLRNEVAQSPATFNPAVRRYPVAQT